MGPCQRSRKPRRPSPGLQVKGASQVMVINTHKDRLALAEKARAIAIDDTEGGGVERIMELTGGKGADRGCECVGYQCCNMHREEVPNLTMNNLVQTVKATGRIGVVGVFVPEDPNAKDQLEKRGRMAFDFGAYWFKGQSMGTGQANVKAYNRLLSRLIEKHRIKPSWIVSHELSLDEAPDGLREFRSAKEGLDQGRAEARHLTSRNLPQPRRPFLQR